MARRKKNKNKKVTQTTTTTTTSTNRRKNRNRSRNRRRRNMMMSGSGGSGSKDLALSYNDPFGFAGCIPDGSRNTRCFSLKTMAILGTGTGSACAFFFTWQPNAQGFTDSGSTAATPTVTGNYFQSGAVATVNNLYAKYRPVSGGVRITYTGSTSADQGTLLVGLVSGDVAPNVFNGQIITACANYMTAWKVVPVRNGAFVRWLPHGQVEAEDFTPSATATAAVGTPLAKNMDYIAVIGFGMTSNASSALTAEAIFNYEGVLETNAYMPGGVSSDMTTVRAEPGWFGNAMNYITGFEQIASYIPRAVDFSGRVVAAGRALNQVRTLMNGNVAPGLVGSSRAPRYLEL